MCLLRVGPTFAFLPRLSGSSADACWGLLDSLVHCLEINQWAPHLLGNKTQCMMVAVDSETARAMLAIAPA